jgi:hypothetical protein
MTPKEKAIELRDKFYFNTSLTDLEEIKECSFIAVDEIIKEYYPQDIKRCQYWNEVKKQIEKVCI